GAGRGTRSPGAGKGFADRDVTQPGKKGRPMSGRTTARLGVALGLWMGVVGARADDSGWCPTSAPPAVVRARDVIATTRPAVSLGRPVPVAAAAPQTAPPPAAPAG